MAWESGGLGLWPLPTEPFHPHAQGALLPQPPGKLERRLRRSVGQGTTEPRREPGGRGGCRARPVTASRRQKNTNQFA